MPDPLPPIANPYCTATTKDGRPCLAFHVSGSDRCAAHNTDSQHLRWLRANPGVIARLERERDSVVAQIDALNGRLSLIDNELTQRRNNVQQ